MPNPTKAQFDAAAQKVMQTAPAGLSRDQFFALIDKELNPPNPAQGDQIVTGEHEPDTFWGGFGKSLKDQFLHATVDNPMVKEAAHPTGLGGLLSLIIPSEVALGSGGMGAAVKNMAAAGVEGGSKGSGLSRIPGALKAMYKVATDPLTARDRSIVENEQAVAPFRSTGASTPREPVTINTEPDMWDRALKPPQSPIERYAPNTSSSVDGGVESGISDALRTPSPTGLPAARLVGKAPTLQESILDALTEAAQRDKPGISSMAPGAETVGEAALHQSGKFGKSGSKGQPGGYTSGRPATSSNSWDDIGGQISHLEDDLGGQGAGPTGTDVTSQGLEGINSPPAELTPAELQEIRNVYGSVDGAEKAGMDRATFETLTQKQRRYPVSVENKFLDERYRHLIDSENQ